MRSARRLPAWAVAVCLALFAGAPAVGQDDPFSPNPEPDPSSAAGQQGAQPGALRPTRPIIPNQGGFKGGRQLPPLNDVAGQCQIQPLSITQLRTAQDVARQVFTNYEPGRIRPIFVAAVLNLYNTYLVALSGVQAETGVSELSYVEALTQGFYGFGRYSILVQTALDELEIPLGANIILAGHSLGGLLAQNLPFSPQISFGRKWHPVRGLTFGSPVTFESFRQSRVPYRRFAIRGDFFVTMSNHVLPNFASADESNTIWIGTDVGHAFDLHNSYPFSPDLLDYDALGDPRGGRNAALVLGEKAICGLDVPQGSSSPAPYYQPHVRGLIGERLAADALAARGHKILYYKPDIQGTTTPGIDIMTWFQGRVWLIDNKAYKYPSNSRTIKSVPALTDPTNFAKYKADMEGLLARMAAFRPLPADEIAFLNTALTALRNNQFQKAVTNATPSVADSAYRTGLDPSFAAANPDIVFIDLQGS